MNQFHARKMARQLMDEHGLTDWTFRFDNARVRAGSCRYSTKTITLSRHYVALNNEDEVLDTVLHEIAHALAGKGTGHGPVWKRFCQLIGARPERCYDTAKVAMPEGRYRATCPGCRAKFNWHRRPQNVKRWCRRCGPERGLLTVRVAS